MEKKENSEMDGRDRIVYVEISFATVEEETRVKFSGWIRVRATWVGLDLRGASMLSWPQSVNDGTCMRTRQPVVGGHGDSLAPGCYRWGSTTQLGVLS